jgi:hypothetical protein
MPNTCKKNRCGADGAFCQYLAAIDLSNRILILIVKNFHASESMFRAKPLIVEVRINLKQKSKTLGQVTLTSAQHDLPLRVI